MWAPLPSPDSAPHETQGVEGITFRLKLTAPAPSGLGLVGTTEFWERQVQAMPAGKEGPFSLFH